MRNVHPASRRRPPINPTPPPPSTGLPKYGISTGSSIRNWDSSTYNEMFGRMVELAQGQRFAVRVDVFDNGAKDQQIINSILNNNLIPYLCMFGSNSFQSVGTVAQNIATTFKGKPLIFTGPNEPDGAGSGNRWTPSQLANAQVTIYNQVKSVDPNMLVGFGAFFKGNGFANMTDYINNFISIAPTKADFFSFHGYDNPNTHADWDIWDYWFPGGFYSTAQVFKTLLSNAGINKPFISDECGGFVADGDANQATEVTNLLQQAGAGRVVGVWIYNLIEWPGEDNRNAMIRADHTLRPAFTAMKNYIAANP